MCALLGTAQLLKLWNQVWKLHLYFMLHVIFYMVFAFYPIY